MAFLYMLLAKIENRCNNLLKHGQTYMEIKYITPKQLVFRNYSPGFLKENDFSAATFLLQPFLMRLQRTVDGSTEWLRLCARCGLCFLRS